MLVRLAPWCTFTFKPGTNCSASDAQFPTTAGGAITSDGPCSTAAYSDANIVGVLPSPMSSAKQPPRPAPARKPSHASASAW